MKVGIDIVKVSRIHKFLERFENNKALQRFLHDEEISLVHTPSTAAGFWAVKEACSKALGVGIGRECSFLDMKIYKDAKKAPQLALSQKLVKRFSITGVTVSITHDGDYAIAVVALQSSTTHEVKQF